MKMNLFCSTNFACIRLRFGDMLPEPKGEFRRNNRKRDEITMRKSITGSKLLLLALALTVLTGCAAPAVKSSNPITVYLWSSKLFGGYAQYVQSKLPDMEIQFVVGNNDLDFYQFLSDHGGLPDIITSRRFSLYDSAGLKDRLMDLSTTEEAGAIYETYLTSFTDSDGKISWIPVCGMVDGIVANRALFRQYGIPLPTDYESFAAACRAFESVGIRGYVADFVYDYTCLELLQGWSLPELTTLEGQSWRLSYEDPQDALTGLDGEIWPGVFRRMEQFLSDVNVQIEDTRRSYDDYQELFMTGQAAMVRNTGANVALCNAAGMDTVMLPYFGRDGEAWLMTYPSFQLALNQELEQDPDRWEKAMEVMKVMLSEEAQNTLAAGEGVISYNQTVHLSLDPALENLRPYIQQNHLFIRLGSDAFFSASKDVVTKMILGQYDAQQAYEAFDAQLRAPRPAQEKPVLTLGQSYSNTFRSRGGSQAASVMAGSLRACYGTEVLIAPAYSFTGSLLEADYTQPMVGNMIMPNALECYQREMTGAELKQCLKRYVEGTQGGFTPFNPGSLPAVSGIAIEVTETETGYALTGVRRNGKAVADTDRFRVACLNTASLMEPLMEGLGLPFEEGTSRVRSDWIGYIRDGGILAQPENYITLKRK